MKYHFKIHKEKNAYWAEGIELKGCVTQGETLEELRTNMAEALNLYLDEPEDSKIIFPLPKKSVKGRGVAAVLVGPRIAFAFVLRRQRLTKKMTQKQVAEILGLSNLYSYQRLESSKTANPELSTLVRLKQVFPDLKLDDVLAS